MTTFIFWDIENVSFHNLERIMEHTVNIKGDIKRYVVFSKIKEARKEVLTLNGWTLADAGLISKNAADKKIKSMIDEVLADNNNRAGKIIIISEDKGFYKTAKRIMSSGTDVEIICGTKNPEWVRRI